MSELAEILRGFTKSLNIKMLKISAFYLDKQKRLCSLKNMLVIETLRCKISDFLNSNTCFCSQLYGSYFKVDPKKIGNLIHEIFLPSPDSNVGPMIHKAHSLSIDPAGKHSQPQIDGGNFKLIDHVTSQILCKDSRWQWCSSAFFPSSTRPLSDKM